MVSRTKEFRTLGRRIWAKFLRSNVTMLLLPISAGLIFTAIILSWAFGNIAFLRDQTKKDIYQSLRLADTQINSAVGNEFNHVSRAVTGFTSRNEKPPTDVQFWLFDKDSNTLVSNDRKHAPVISERIDRPQAGFTLEEQISSAWFQLQGHAPFPTDQTALQKFGHMAIFDEGLQIGFTLPIVDEAGQLRGIAFASLPTAQFEQFLPAETFLVDSLSSSVIQKDSTHLTDNAKDRLLKGEMVPNELYSVSRKLNLQQAFSNWKIWCDHPVSEVWSRPEVRRALDFSTLLILGIWAVAYALIQSGKKVRNRQRRLIGSLVRKVIWITDEKGTIDYVLGKITSHLGWKEVDYLNVDISLFVHPDDRELVATAISKAQETTVRDEILEIRFENKDREYRWYEVTVSNMMDVPEINGIIITAHDIEQRKHATDHILASKRAAEKANEAKSEFLSRMSHELRTPLNAILGFGQLLEMESISDRQAENVGQILIAGRHLLNLVNDILDIARIETRKVNLSVEKVNIREVVEESFALLGPLAAKSNISLVMEAGECPDVWSDRQRLKQVILNLTSNGIKYNNAGGQVCVTCALTPDGLDVAVSDTGIGIESHYLDRVFTPFDRLGSDNSQVEGSGLGLALSKTLVEAMGANLGVRSEHGKGSTFTIHFKTSSIVIAEPELPKDESDDFFGMNLGNPGDFRILLIEDNVVNLRYVSKVVEKMDGVVLISAKEGGIGIEMARAHCPDLILLDLDLPDLNGQEVLKTLRYDERTAGMRIVVMSAETNPHIVENVLNLGADQFVTKPVDVNSLVHLFSEERRAA